MSVNSTNPRWVHFGEFLTARMGLHFPPERQGELVRGMTLAAAEFGFTDPEPCVEWLLNTPLARSQIEILASTLTVGETYFFREKRTFELLEKQVLPALIAARRYGERRLRFWSAACCTGEEPYSLAIVLRRLLPDLAEWNITILATDINPSFLRKATAGVFRDWSFRDAPDWLKEQYFRPGREGQYEIQPQIRRMVSFAYLNLADDAYPSLLNDTHAMDLILCRNVLMYFAPKPVRNVVAGLCRALVPGGWLVVSPVEVPLAASEGLVPINFPDAVFFRRGKRLATTMAPGESTETPGACDAAPDGGHSPTEIIPPSVVPGAESATTAGTRARPATSPMAVPELVQEAGRLHRCGQTPAAQEPLAAAVTREPHAREPLAAAVTREPHAWEALALRARALADDGRLAEALAHCDQALAQNKLHVAGHYLRSTILVEQGETAEAIRALHRVLYLEPDFVLAHFALGNLFRRQTQDQDANRSYRTALTLLARCGRDDLLPEGEGMTAGRLTEVILSYLKLVSTGTGEA